MNRQRHFIALWLLAGAALMASTPAAAAPHEPPPVWQDPAGPPVDMGTWLRRLVGRYTFDGVAEVLYYEDRRCGVLPPDPATSDNPPPTREPYCSGIKGKGDCVGIGSGPGVQCILNVRWTDMYDVDEGIYNLPGGISNLAPSMLLFGMDPNRAGINYLLVDNKGLPEGGLGSNAGNRATFSTPCVNAPSLFAAMKEPPPPPQECIRTLRIEARPDARVLYLSVEIEINDDLWTRYDMTMRRVAPPPQNR